MSEPEVKFEIDEHGRIGYRVTNEGVLLSKDEKEFIIDHVTRMQEENAKLRSICAEVAYILFNLDVDHCGLCDRDSINHPCPVHTVKGGECLIESELRELGVEV